MPIDVSEVLSSYNWFAPLCRCVHEDGLFKGLKKLNCWTNCCFQRGYDLLPDLSEEETQE